MTDFYRFLRAPLALLLAAALLFSFSSCGLIDPSDISQIIQATDPTTDTQTNRPSADRTFSLAYYTEDTLDPFLSSSRTNAELLKLCYSGLFSVDRTYTAQPVLVQSYEVDGNAVNLTLRNDVFFSDGSPVTAEDCQESFRLAAQSGSIWKDAFSYILSYSAMSEKVFRVEFQSYSPTQLNLLTVPIVKLGEKDSNGFYFGCGRYLFSSGEPLSLVRSHRSGIDGSYDISEIALMGIRDQEDLIYNFNYGRIQAVYADLAQGSDEYRSNSELVTFTSNRFSFLVVNKRSTFSSAAFSRGLTYLIDRNALVSQALSSFGTPVWYPLNPAWDTVKNATLNPDISSAQQAGDAFAEAGMVLEGDVRIYNGTPVTLRLLVNKENAVRVKVASYLAETLRGAGFGVDVIALAWDEYRAAIEERDFDLYLGEVSLPENMDISALFTSAVCNSGSTASYSSLKKSAANLLKGTVDVRTFVNEFHTALPLIPLYYSLDALAVSMDVSGSFGSSVSSIYAGIENWTFAQKKY